MANSIARYLIPAGATGSVKDDQGSTDLILSGSNLTRGSDSAGGYLENTETPASDNSVAVASIDVDSEIGTALDGVTKAVMVAVVENINGHGWGSRLAALGTSVGSGDFSLLAGPGGYLFVRWGMDDNGGGEVEFPYLAAGKTIVGVKVESTQADAADRIKIWYNGVQRTATFGSIAQNVALDNINDGDRYITIMNRQGGGRNPSGRVRFVEFFTDITDQEMVDLTTPLSTDDDSSPLSSEPVPSINPANIIIDGEANSAYTPQNFDGAITSVTIDGVAVSFNQTTFDNFDIVAQASDAGTPGPKLGTVQFAASDGTDTVTADIDNIPRTGYAKTDISVVDTATANYLYDMMQGVGLTLSTNDQFNLSNSDGSSINPDGSWEFFTLPKTFQYYESATGKWYALVMSVDGELVKSALSKISDKILPKILSKTIQ